MNDHFRPCCLLNPVYLLKRAGTIKSFEDLQKRLVNIFVLAKKIISGEYGKAPSLGKFKKRRTFLHPDIRRTNPPYMIFLNWDMHYECNYSCSYCFFANRWTESAKMNLYPGMARLKAVIDSLFEQYGGCHIQLSGGEPSTYPDFMDLLLCISGLHNVELTTNLTFDMRHFTKRISPEKVKISSSFHPEFSPFDAFMDKVLLLKNCGFHISITYVAFPPNLRDLDRIRHVCENKEIPFFLQPFRGIFQGKNYPAGYAESEMIPLKLNARKDKVNRLLLDCQINKKKLTGKLCRMGQMYAKIYPNGEAYRCCAPDASNLGNLFDGSFKLLDGPELCESEFCPCWKAMIAGFETSWLCNWH